MKNKLAMPLTLFSLLLIVVGIAGGTLLTQKQTRTASLAATGATCADNPWRPNGGTSPYDYSACGVRFGAQYAVGQCGYNTSVNKYFLCKRNPSNPIIPNDENWFGPCDRPEDCQAAQTAAGSPTTAPQGPQPTSPPAATQPTTVPQGTSCNAVNTSVGCSQNEFDSNICPIQPHLNSNLTPNKYYECRQVGTVYYWFGPCDYNLCTTPPSPTPTPVVATTTINTSIKFVFNLGQGLSTPSVFAPPPPIPTPNTSYFTIVLTSALNTNIDKRTLALNKMGLSVPSHYGSDTTNYYQIGQISDISMTVPTSLIKTIGGLNVQVLSTDSNGTSQSIPFCNGLSKQINQTVSINDATQINNFLNTSQPFPLTITIDCSGVVSAIVKVTAYSRTQLEDTVKQYVNETIGTLEMSAYLSELSRIPRMGWKFCDVPSGGCTAKF